MTTTSGWHPVALSQSIEPGSSAGTHLAGYELVVWRDNSGAAHVWEDRCPHRGMKLSFGFVRGDHIACLYHGWQYDSAGQCRYIPAHPELDVPKSITVRVYRTVEAAGMIWTTTEPAESAPAAPPDQGETVPVRSVYVEAGSEAVIAAIMAAPPTPFDGEAVPAELRRIGDNLCALKTGTDTLLFGLQRVSDTRTAVHVAIAGGAPRYAGKAQAHFLAWAAGLRHRLEPSGQPRVTEAA